MKQGSKKDYVQKMNFGLKPEFWVLDKPGYD